MSRWILILFLFVFPALLSAQVYHIPIEGTIDMGLPPFIKRVISEAERQQAKAVLLEVNTFGGRVDAATEIKDLLLNANLLTIAYVNKRAISAGALISLSCKKIGMAPGSSIGAATVVDMGGKKAPEKAISYFRAEMGATAERNGRDRKIAEGMVDEDVEIPGLSEKGKLITLTADDAVKWKMADVIAPTLEALLDSLDLGNETVIYAKINWAEKTVRFLTDPVVSSFLISLGLLGLFFEIKSPGWGVPGTLGLLFLALFFGSHYIINLANVIEIVLFLVGLALLLLEIFVIPGFGVAGISGILLMIGGIFLSLIGALKKVTAPDLNTALLQLGGALFFTIVVAGIMIRFFPKTSFWKKIALAEEEKQEAGYVSTPNYSQYIGREGIALSSLRPAGVGLFEGERLDVVSEGGFIEKEAPIKIIRVEGYRLLVRKIEEENSST